jgi:hypothetical protein
MTCACGFGLPSGVDANGTSGLLWSDIPAAPDEPDEDDRDA